MFPNLVSSLFLGLLAWITNLNTWFDKIFSLYPLLLQRRLLDDPHPHPLGFLLLGFLGIFWPTNRKRKAKKSKYIYVLFLNYDISYHIIYFLAAMSSSSSDDVTQLVS